MAKDPLRGLVPDMSAPKGSIFRLAASGGYRSLVAAGATAAAVTAADGATATFSFTFTEAFIADRLILDANAAVALVAGNAAGLAGAYVTTFTINGDSFISGNVPARVFDPMSNWNPVLGVNMIPAVSQVSVIVTNQTGAGIEAGAAFTCR